MLQKLKGHKNVVYSISFNLPYADKVGTGSFDQTAKLWNVKDGKCLTTFRGHNGEIVCLAFDPNSSQMVTGSMDKTAILWNLETEQKLFDITSTFYSRNHFNVLQDSKEVLSKGAQDCGCFEHGQRAFLWVDGITYADNFSNDKFEIFVHTTFLGFDELQKDQKKVLFPEYLLYLQLLQSLFPLQFDGKTIEKLKASFKMDSNN